MFVLLARYTVPADKVDTLLEEHKAWIGANADKILLTAREEPLIGGLILAKGESLEAMWEMVKQDPFHVAGYSEYEIRQYNPVRAAAGVEGLLGA